MKFNIEKLFEIYLKIFPLRIIKYHNFCIERFVKNISRQYDINGKKMLDVGAEKCPYKKYFKKLKYFSQDIQQNKTQSINFIGDINEGLPEIKDGSFDYILCTQVLEHIREPHKVFKEFNRILKPEGRIFLTTHMCYDEHMIPYDYFRFTKYGLAYLGESNGFKLEHISPHGGIFQVIARIFDTLLIKLFLKRDSFFYYLYIAIFTIPIFIFNSLCYLLDFLDREKTMTLNYECVYRKNKEIDIKKYG